MLKEIKVENEVITVEELNEYTSKLFDKLNLKHELPYGYFIESTDVDLPAFVRIYIHYDWKKIEEYKKEVFTVEAICGTREMRTMTAEEMIETADIIKACGKFTQIFNDRMDGVLVTRVD